MIPLGATTSISRYTLLVTILFVITDSVRVAVVVTYTNRRSPVLIRKGGFRTAQWRLTTAHLYYVPIL